MVIERDLTQRLLIIDLVVLDVDGVLTDGTIYKSESGEEMLGFHVRDGMGIARLMEEGVRVAVLTGRSSGAVRARTRELGIDRIVLGRTDKGDAIEGIVRDAESSLESTAFVGDDLADIGAMDKVGLAVAVADAAPEVKAAADMVLDAPGGRGAVREFAEIILKARGRWNKHE